MEKIKALQFVEAPISALSRWEPEVVAAKKDDKAVNINIYSTVGDYGDGQGMTAKLVSSLLRNAGPKADVVVNINSPGGDFFEGLAIHTLLKEHKGNVETKVVGLAASAASVVALAGDKISIAESGFFMIHNSWTAVVGNSQAMAQASDMLAKFDESMVNLYVKATGMDEKKIRKMMDAETWLSGAEALDMGFASALMASDEIKKDDSPSNVSALRKIDVSLAKAGMPRAERRALIKEITASTPRAADTTVKPSADHNLSLAIGGLLYTLNPTF